MKFCKKCKEVSCIGCYETKRSKIRRKYYNLKFRVKKIFKFKEYENSIDYTWRNDQYDDNWGKNDNWEKDFGEEELKFEEELNFEKEAIEEIDDITKRIYIEQFEGKIEDKDIVEISIEKIKYSQRRINPLFQSNDKGIRENIYNVIKELKEGELLYGRRKENLPLINIVIKDNKVYSMDNRRLYCLKEVYKNNENICCIYRKENVNFKRKRIQSIYESERELGEKNFKYNSVIIDKYAKGRRFIV